MLDGWEAAQAQIQFAGYDRRPCMMEVRLSGWTYNGHSRLWKTLGGRAPPAPRTRG
jgi:hypothetical protein